MWTSIEIIDDYKIRVNFTEYQNNWPGLFATNSHMISPTAVEKNGEEWAYYHPVGTGPFKFKSFQKDVFLEYERFDDYWDGKPYLDGISYTIIKDPVTQTVAFLKGDVDVLETNSEKVVSDLKAKGYKVESKFVIINVLEPDSANPNSPFANAKVREAVEYAIERPKIVKAISHGFWKDLTQACPQGNMGYVSDLGSRDYDPEKARKLLKEAGYPSGFNTQLIASTTDSRDALLAIQSYLRTVGINTNLNVVDRGRFSEYDLKGWHNGLVYIAWGHAPNYVHTMERFLGPTGPRGKSLLRPEGWKEVLGEALTAKDFQVHKKLTQKAVKFIYDNTMVIPLWEVPNYAVHQEYVYNTNFFTPRIMEWTSGKAYISK